MLFVTKVRGSLSVSIGAIGVLTCIDESGFKRAHSGRGAGVVVDVGGHGLRLVALFVINVTKVRGSLSVSIGAIGVLTCVDESGFKRAHSGRGAGVVVDVGGHGLRLVALFVINVTKIRGSLSVSIGAIGVLTCVDESGFKRAHSGRGAGVVVDVGGHGLRLIALFVINVTKVRGSLSVSIGAIGVLTCIDESGFKRARSGRGAGVVVDVGGLRLIAHRCSCAEKRTLLLRRPTASIVERKRTCRAWLATRMGGPADRRAVSMSEGSPHALCVSEPI